MTRADLQLTAAKTGNVRIVALRGPALLLERMREMGFHEGSEIEIVGRLAFGGPWLIRIGAEFFRPAR